MRYKIGHAVELSFFDDIGQTVEHKGVIADVDDQKIVVATDCDRCIDVFPLKGDSIKVTGYVPGWKDDPGAFTSEDAVEYDRKGLVCDTCGREARYMIDDRYSCSKYPYGCPNKNRPKEDE